MKIKKLIGIFSKAVVLGSIAVFILIIIRFVAVLILEGLHEFWSSFFVLFGTTGIIATTLEYAEAILYTTTLVGVVGLLFLAKGRGKRSMGEKTIGKVPVLKTLWGFLHNISEFVHNVTERPFILLLDWPGEGHHTIGVITKKLKFGQNGKLIFSKPVVYITTPPNPTSGFLDLPDRNKLILLTSPANHLMQLIVSIGMLGPAWIELAPDPDQSLLDSYYS